MTLVLQLQLQICRVLDAAEFCRNVHSDIEWRQAAQQVCIELGGYVHDLNTHYGLYTALVHAMEPAQPTALPDSTTGSRSASASTAPPFPPSMSGSSSCQAWPPGFCEETLLVARMLRRDFERYGVHLSGEARDRMTALVQETQELGMLVTQNVLDPAHYGSLTLDASQSGEGQGAWGSMRGAVGNVRGQVASVCEMQEAR